MIILALYLIFFILALLLVVAVYRRLRPRSLLLAIGGGLLTLFAFMLFFPIPIHGGFTFPLEIAWYEIKKERTQDKAERRREKRQAFADSLQQRFAGVISNYQVVSDEGAWQRVIIANAQQAQLDTQSGLLWLPPQSVDTRGEALNLNLAYTFCQQQPPQGYWSLANEAELAQLWQHDGHHLMPGTGQSSITLLSDETLQLHMPTYYRGTVEGYSLRCVALTENAPRRGYMGSDIPLSVWNEYQLNKNELYKKPTLSSSSAFDQEVP